MGFLKSACGQLSDLLVFSLVFVVRLYQCTLSHYLGKQCRFIPSCSEYCIQALRSHGLFRGSVMGVWRILRCNPFCRGGYDPVP